MSKKNRYKRIKDKFLIGASSGLMAGILFMGSGNSALAETYNNPSYYKSATSTGMHVMRRWNSRTKINSLVSTLGLDQGDIESELNSGKSIKQILIERGVATSSLDKAFNAKSRHKSWKKHQI